MLEAWDKVNIEVGLSINHVYKLISRASDPLDLLRLKAEQNLIHNSLVRVMRTANNGFDRLLVFGERCLIVGDCETFFCRDCSS